MNKYNFEIRICCIILAITIDLCVLTIAGSGQVGLMLIMFTISSFLLIFANYFKNSNSK